MGGSLGRAKFGNFGSSFVWNWQFGASCSENVGNSNRVQNKEALKNTQDARNFDTTSKLVQATKLSSSKLKQVVLTEITSSHFNQPSTQQLHKTGRPRHSDFTFSPS